MALYVRCPKGHEYIQSDIYVDWPKGAPHCPQCYEEWKIKQIEPKLRKMLQELDSEKDRIADALERK